MYDRGNDERMNVVDTGARWRWIRVRDRGGYGCATEVDTGVHWWWKYPVRGMRIPHRRDFGGVRKAVTLHQI